MSKMMKTIEDDDLVPDFEEEEEESSQPARRPAKSLKEAAAAAKKNQKGQKVLGNLQKKETWEERKGIDKISVGLNID